MKKMILCIAILFSAVAVNSVSAQVRVNVNISSQPQWGPAGYDYVDYYYLPDIETYYYVPSRKFIYYSGGKWIHVSTLPPAHRAYNLHSGYKVVINEPNAYHYHNSHKVKYAKYKGNRGQGNLKHKNSGNGRGKKKGHH